MARVLLGDVMHDGVLFPKGTKFDKGQHKEIEHLFGEGEAVVAEQPADQTPAKEDGDKTKAQLLEEIKAVEGVTDEQLAEYAKLNKAELLAVHKEIVG